MEGFDLAMIVAELTRVVAQLQKQMADQARLNKRLEKALKE